MVEETKNVVEAEKEEVVWTAETARKALEEAREAENRAYHGMKHAVLTSRQKGVLELAKLEEEENPDQAMLDHKCKLILESYYLPRILKEGHTFKLNKEFTRTDEPEKDYIEAVFTSPSGKTRNVGYNYKIDKDGKSIVLFEKVFQTIVLKPGDPEKYVLYDFDGKTEIMTYNVEELERKVSKGDIVKVENEYFRKATNADGDVREGETTMIVEDEGLNNTKIILGNNEQHKYSFSKNGQLVRATTNDVTTVTIETRKITGPGPVFNSVEDARRAAAREVQEGETNLRVDVGMEGSTVAEFDFLPVYTTSIELTGLSKKIGKGVEDYEPSESDEENLRRQLAKPIQQYLDEKGYHVLDITCENITADVKENVGWINTMKTYQMTGGTVTVTYIKRHSAVVSLKQGFLGRGQVVDENVVLGQLPEGSVLLNPQDIDWKNPKPTVTYVLRGHATGIGSAKSANEADDAAAQSAISEGQKIAVKGLNGGIASGIREAIDGKGGVSTVANVRARLETAVVSKNDMALTRKESKYAYTATCDKMVTTTENKLVSVTSWNGSKLVYIPATEPVLDKGIPSDENYEKYVKTGDDLGILIFENSDKGLRRYVDEVHKAQVQAGASITLYERSRVRLREAQEIFDKAYDEKVARMARDAEDAVENIDEAAVAALAAEQAAMTGKSVPGTKSVLDPISAPRQASVLELASVPKQASVLEMPSMPKQASVLEMPSMPKQASVLEPTIVPKETSVLEPAHVEMYLPLEETMMKSGTNPVEEPAVESVSVEEPVAESVPVEESVDTVEPVVEPAPVAESPTMTAQEALLNIFGESAVAEPVAVDEPVPAAKPTLMVEMPEMPAEDNRMLTAQEALYEIFGESVAEESISVAESAPAVESVPVIEPISVEEPVPAIESALAVEPMSYGAPVEAVSVETLAQSQEDVDAAFAKLLSGEM